MFLWGLANHGKDGEPWPNVANIHARLCEYAGSRKLDIKTVEECQTQREGA